MKNLTEQIIWRFIAAGLYSALSTATVVTYYTGVTTWEQFQSATSAIALSALIGFITGILMAIHKYFTGPTEAVSTAPLESSVE